MAGVLYICTHALRLGESLPAGLASVYIRRLNKLIKNGLFDEFLCLHERRNGLGGREQVDTRYPEFVVLACNPDVLSGVTAPPCGHKLNCSSF